MEWLKSSNKRTCQIVFWCAADFSALFNRTAVVLTLFKINISILAIVNSALLFCSAHMRLWGNVFVKLGKIFVLLPGYFYYHSQPVFISMPDTDIVLFNCLRKLGQDKA